MNGIELLGWIATGITLISMMVKDMIVLRVINSVGCILWISYGMVRSDVPIIVVNGTILVIHIVALIKEEKKKKIIHCDVCGKEFSSPDEGQIQQGFGMCNECGND